MIRLIVFLCLLPTCLMATTLYDMRIMVYELLDADSTNRVFTTHTVQRHIDYAQAEVAADAMCIVSTTRANLVAFTESYLVDSNMVHNGVLEAYIEHYESAELDELRGLKRHRLKDFGASGQKVVNWYDVVGFNVFLNIIPTSEDTTDTLVVKYAENATAMTITDSTSVIEIPKDFELALAYKACALIYLSRQMPELANVFEQYYEKEISKRRQYYPAAVTDSPVIDKPVGP